MNYLNNNEIVQKDIINDTNKDSMKSQCRNIGKISGIYKIINKIDNKYYVGSSKNIYKRWRKHKSLLRHNKHINDYLQNAFNLHGEINFESCGGDHSIHSIEKIRLGRINFFKNPKNRKIASDISKKQWANIEFKETRLGKNHPLYNSMKYTFYNRKTNITEHCTMNDLYTKYNLYRSNVWALCMKRIKSVKNWILIHNPE